MLVFLFLFAIFAQSLGQRTSRGMCPQPKPIPNFDENKLVGDWYEWGRIPSYYEPDAACGLISYYRGKDGNLVERAISIIRRSGTWIFWEGRLVPKGSQPTATYDLKFPEYSQDKSLQATFIAANADHWAILHTCKQENDQAVEFVWIWSKNTTLEQQYQDEVANYLKQLNLNMHDIYIVDQNNCPYLKTSDPLSGCFQ
ncbi:apolipoprotein D [Fopius arisanus]|uniref:APOD_4 protein n=1 Tax=Fopius arisanus TaxID=64838 RepID=A0A0C9RM67_9HYME|nr:PREDICTED: apolipoprotein D-like [Fopius arisanus]